MILVDRFSALCHTGESRNSWEMLSLPAAHAALQPMTVALPSSLSSCFVAEMVEGKSAILLGMSQWNSNDLVEQIETLGHQGRTRGRWRCPVLTAALSDDVIIVCLLPTDNLKLLVFFSP